MGGLLFDQSILRFFDVRLKFLQMIVGLRFDLLQRFVTKAKFIELRLIFRLDSADLRLVAQLQFFHLRLQLLQLSALARTAGRREVLREGEVRRSLPQSFEFFFFLGDFLLQVAAKLVDRGVQDVVFGDFDVKLFAVLIDR